MLNQLQGVFASFHKHEVKYVIIGGIAAILYGVPRATFDLDILIDPTPENARKLLDAMIDAGLGTAVSIRGFFCPLEKTTTDLSMEQIWGRTAASY